MTPQNINEIYAVIEVVNGKEVGILTHHDSGSMLCLSEENLPFLKELAQKIIEFRVITKKNTDLSGLLVKFTNREVISVFGGEI